MKTQKPLGSSLRLERFKVWAESVQAVATILALLAGGYWFYLQRAIKPQVKLDQTVTQRPVAGDPSQMLITLDVRATNIGKVKVDLKPGTVELIELNPEDTTAKLSFPLHAMILEPGESDQAIFQTINFPDSIQTIQVHSAYQVPDTHDYWNLLSAVDIGPGAGKKEAASSVH